MNIFTRSNRILKFLFTAFSFLLTVIAANAQFCLGTEIRPDDANPDEVFLDLTTNEFEDVAAMQFTLEFDPEVYEYIGFVESNLADFQEGSFIANPPGFNGVLTIAWFDLAALGITYTEDKPLATLKFKKLSEADAAFVFSDNPTNIEVAICTGLGPSDCKVLYNVENCGTGENLVPSIKGRLILDTNENCQIEEEERANTTQNWDGFTVAFSQNGKYFFSGTLDSDGSYETRVFSGENLVEIFKPGPYFNVCVASLTINTNELSSDFVLESIVQITDYCPSLEVNLGSFPHQPCEEAVYLLEYANNGTADEKEVYIDLNLDDRLDIKFVHEDVFIPLGNNNYRVNIGDLPVGTRNGFFIAAEIPCELSEEESIRNDAQIYPATSCQDLIKDWSGASLKVDGKCENGNITFQLKNVGNNDMVAPVNYLVIEDAVIFRSEQIKLARGATETFSVPANGSTYFLQAEQESGHPGDYRPSAFIEACGRNETGQFSTGFANRFPEETNDSYVDVDYQFLSARNVKHRLVAAPIGYSEEHFIEPNNAIEYTIYFNNRLRALEIEDVLSDKFNISTFKPISASSNYNYTLEEGVLRISVPLAVGNGGFGLLDEQYIKFSIQPKADLAMGTVVEHQATLIYNENQSEETNKVFHTIEEDFVKKTTSIPLIPTRLSNVTIAPNPSSDFVIFTIKDWVITDYQLNIINVDGKIIQKRFFNSATYRFDKGELPSGTYLYQLIEPNGVTENGFFILID